MLTKETQLRGKKNSTKVTLKVAGVWTWPLRLNGGRPVGRYIDAFETDNWIEVRAKLEEAFSALKQKKLPWHESIAGGGCLGNKKIEAIFGFSFKWKICIQLEHHCWILNGILFLFPYRLHLLSQSANCCIHCCMCTIVYVYFIVHTSSLCLELWPSSHILVAFCVQINPK